MESANAADPRQGEGQQQHRFFDLACESYTPQMWMHDLERFRASGADPAELHPLHAAAVGGRADIVQCMLDKGYDKDMLSSEGCTALQDAAVMGHMSVTQALLSAGADVSLRCQRDMSSLDRAAGTGHVDVARAIIEHGADVNAACDDGSTPLHRAAISGWAEMVPLLCLNGAEVDKANERGRTPLQLAAVGGHAVATQALLAAGADANCRNGTDKLSALDQAASQGHADVVAALVEHGTDVDELGPGGNAALHHAASSGETDTIRLLCLKGAVVDKVSGDGLTPLYMAAVGNFMGATQALLVAGADVSIQFQCDSGSMSVLNAVAGEGHVEIARVLLEHGADANAASDTGCTPLHTAAVRERPEMVSLLFLNGANADTFNDQGFSPLQFAALHGHAATARALLIGGADATLRNGAGGRSALDMAANGGHVDVLRAMIEHGVDVNDAAGDGVNALHFAAVFDKTASIEVLVGAGADVEAQFNGNRKTPLFLAAKKSNVSAVFVLLKHGASVITRNATEQTPLHGAAAYAGRLRTAEVVDLLLRRGADENAVDSDGQTPADLVGSEIEEEDRLAEDVERVRRLLANAPADRAWRRRCFLVLCRAYYPGGRVQLGQGSSHGHDAGIAKRTRSCPQPSRAEAEWAGVASMLMGVGADPISLMGDGADIIFETIVGYL